MTTPESPQYIEPVLDQTTLMDTMRDRWNYLNSDEMRERGAINLNPLTAMHEVFKMKSTAIGAVVLSAVVGGIGLWHKLDPVKTETSITAGQGMLKSVFPMDAKECHGGYINTVSGAKSEIKKTVFGISTTYRASESFTGDITDEVCNTGVDGEMEMDRKTHKIKLTLPASAFATTVYQTNPADAKAWTSDNGLAVAVMQNFANTVKVLPGGLDVKAGDELSSKLRGWALLSAYELSSRGCGKTAWAHLKPIYEQELKKQVVDDNNNKSFSDVKIKTDDVTVVLPDSISFKNQYEGQFNTLQGQLAKADVSFNKIDPNTFVCRDLPSPSGGAK